MIIVITPWDVDVDAVIKLTKWARQARMLSLLMNGVSLFMAITCTITMLIERVVFSVLTINHLMKEWID